MNASMLLEENSFFSCMDLNQRFMQLPIAKEDRPYTAIATTM
jgi:hypothetical protein